MFLTLAPCQDAQSVGTTNHSSKFSRGQLCQKKVLPQLGSRLAVLDTTTLEAAFIGFTRIQSLVPENIFPMKKRDRAEQKIKVQISSENVSTTFEVT